jgi:RHS repeat-associated protein
MFAAAPFSLKGDGFGSGFGFGDLRDVLKGVAGNDRGRDLATLRLSLGPGLARDEPAGTGKKWPAQKRVRELVDRRTANGKFFQLSDGRVQGEVATGPIHYRDGDGKWRPIDTRVRDTKRAGFVVGNSTNTFTSLFGDSTDRLVRFEWEGRSVELGLPGKARTVKPVVDGSTVTYRGLLGGADLVYVVTPTTLKENIVLRSKPASAVSYPFTVATRGLAARQGRDGSVSFTGLDGGRPVLTLPAPFMFDDRDDRKSPHGKVWSDKVTQKLTRTNGKTLVTVTPDAKWLSDSARKYPVTVDPTVKIQPIPAGGGKDVQIYSGSTATNYNTTYQLNVGTDATHKYRSLVEFPLTGVPSNTVLDDARLELYYDQTHWTWEYDVAMEARRVTAAWTEDGVNGATWGNMNANFAGQPAGNVVTVDDGDPGTSVVGTWPYSANPDLTPLAINSDYRYNNDATAGHSHTWVPTITETGDYQVEVHYVSATDRPTNTPYTVYHASGTTNYSVSQYESTTSEGKWSTLGVHRFNAGTTHKVVVGDVANKAVIVDAVRFSRWGVATKKAAKSSTWSSFPVRNVVQDWVNGTHPNYGFMIKATDENKLGRGGPTFEASEYAYANGGREYNLPRLILTWGRPGVTLSPLTTVTSTGALLGWSAYQDPSGSPDDDIIEYQVHRSVRQTFVPSAKTLVSPIAPGTLSYQDTSATPTPADTPEDQIGQYYYYMVAVKTRDGQVIPAPTQGARLPKAGHVTKIFRTSLTDTTLSAARPTENVDVYDGDPYVSPGNNSTYYGDTRGLVKFGSITGIPTDAQVTRAQLRMWNTYLYPGTDTDEWVDVHKLTRAFGETTATWNMANSTTAWTTPGGDYEPTPLSGFNGFTNDPEWETWDVRNAVDGWIDTPTSNYGFLLKMRDESVSTARSMLLASEASETLLRPTLEVTYLEKTPASTYYVASTPARMIPGDLYTVPISISNTTLNTWAAATWELSYRWTLPDGTDVTNSGNQLATPLPQDLSPGETEDFSAQLKTPIQSDAGNKRTEYVLKWELRNKTTGQWLSETDNIASLNQNVTVEDPTSNQLGLEKFYAYAGKNTGAGSTVMNNLYAGNTVWSYNALANPSRGLSTFVRLAYNSQDTSDTVAGYGWSLQASSLMRLGSPLDFHPNPNPTTVTLTDGDGTSHTFTWNAATSEWVNPKGVHLYLQNLVACGQQTEEDRAWVLTRPDRTQFYYDCDGYLSATVDNNGNELLFTYEERNSNNKPTKFLRYITDPAGRQTLTLTYYAKGENYDYIDDVTWTRQSATNLTNQKIIDHVKTITDISGRQLTFTYTDKGLLGELIDGAGSSQPKIFKFRYDMTQGNNNVKLVRATDPRGNATNLAYYSNPDDDPKFKWWTKTYTDRLGEPTTFGYTDPDGQAGSNIQTVVTDAESHATTYLMDGFGRPTQTTNAKNQITILGWDADNNVIRLEEANGAVSTWVYDQKTGYPTEIKDAEAVANNWPGTILTYQTQLNGHVAEVISKTSPEGRRWTFGYTLEGDLEWVVDPLGNTTPTDPDDYKTSHTYDTWGQLLTATDANGNVTTNSNFDANGYPSTITDALTRATTFEYDVRGNVTKVTDASGKETTQTYDAFGRPLENRVPKDQAGGVFITTPAPVYDPNDNVVTSTAPNGAVTSASYDVADQLSHILAPLDNVGDPERKTSFTYDKVGNLLTATEPKGNLTPTDPNDFKTTNSYDEIYQLTAVVNAAGHRLSYEYDNVGNVAKVIDPRKNATSDPADYTTVYGYDRAHRVTRVTDAAGKFTTSTYDKDGMVTATTDQLGNTATTVLDARGMPMEMRIPHKDVSGTITYRITKYEYDEVGNQTRMISPRGVATTSDPDDFATVTVYDELNRAKESWSAYDPDDSRYNTPDKTFYSYDAVGRLAKVSAPPSAGQTVRNDTTYTYFDNGWTRTSTDPWDIATSYDYNTLGLQTSRTVSSAGGSSNRTMAWVYHPDGKLKARADDGVPVGKQVVLVDNSDFNNTSTTGTWTAGTTGTGLYGHNYHTHAAGLGTDAFTWKLNIPQGGNYEVFVRYPQVAGAASDAKFTVTHEAGSTDRTVDQTVNSGTWVSLGTYAFVEGNTKTVKLFDSLTGSVAADAVKLVRDNSGETDSEKQDFTYAYDPNGNMSTITDASPGALIDTYAITYTGLNQVQDVKEKLAGVVKNTTAFTYNENGAPRTMTHDKQHASYEYDVRDLVSSVSNGTSPTDPDPKVTTYTYTDRGERLREVKGNGNTVDYTYYLDGLLKTQMEKKSNGTTLVSDHTIDYTLNGHRSRDVVRKMNADNHAAYLNTTTDYTYDPRDRVATVTKTGDGAGSESYVHDANNNVIEQTLGGVTTVFNYDRNRLLTSTAGGVTSTYNYDPFGRLDTVTSGGTTVERNIYDGFDHTIENRKTVGGSTTTTRYVFDPLDRTVTKTTKVGAPGEKTTRFNYLGLSSEVLDEEVAGQVTKSYQYSPWGERLSQTKHNTDGSKESGFYGHNPHSDVEQVTDTAGDTKATYGYTAYGSNDDAQFTGIDKPDPADPTKEPYNPYRFNAKRFDPASGGYDMGFRDYNPGLNRFTTRDNYNGALADQNLGLDPWTGNRYAFAGGNPITGIELDGHKLCGDNECNLTVQPTSTNGDYGSVIDRRPSSKRPDVTIKPVAGKKYPSCFAANELPCKRGGDPNDPRFYTEYIVNLAQKLGLDPRLLLATLMLESRACLGWTGQKLCAIQHGVQMNSPEWPFGQGDEASIGITNMDKKTFEAVKERFPDQFAGREWDDIRTTPVLAIKAMAYRMKDLKDQLPERSGAGRSFTEAELIDFGYRGNPEAMVSVTLGREPMANHGTEHLALFRGFWAEADNAICGSGYWTCA